MLPMARRPAAHDGCGDRRRSRHRWAGARRRCRSDRSRAQALAGSQRRPAATATPAPDRNPGTVGQCSVRYGISLSISSCLHAFHALRSPIRPATTRRRCAQFRRDGAAWLFRSAVGDRAANWRPSAAPRHFTAARTDRTPCAPPLRERGTNRNASSHAVPVGARSVGRVQDQLCELGLAQRTSTNTMLRRGL